VDNLYTPWRMQYLTEDKKSANEDCVFCGKARFVDDATDQAQWIVARSQFVYVTLNKYPYNNGHTLIVPYEHIASLEDMPAEALTDMMLTLNHTLAAIRKI